MKQGKLIRRAVSAVLAGCMMFTLLPVVAFAAPGTLMIGSNSYETETDIPEQELGGGTINYDAETHTLTLNGVNIEDSSHDWVIDFNDMDTLLNLVLVGKNILKGHGGISAPKLKISGNGSLQITATEFDGIAGAGQSEENLTIGSNVDITAMNGCAIAFNGSVRIENGVTENDVLILSTSLYSATEEPTACRSPCIDFLPPSGGVFRLSFSGSSPGIPCRRSCGFQGAVLDLAIKKSPHNNLNLTILSGMALVRVCYVAIRKSKTCSGSFRSRAGTLNKYVILNCWDRLPQKSSRVNKKF